MNGRVSTGSSSSPVAHKQPYLDTPSAHKQRIAKWTIVFMLATILPACSAPQEALPPKAASSVQAPANTPSPVSATSSGGSVDRGAALFKTGHGALPSCSTCHSTGHEKIVGPGLGGLHAVAGQRVPGLSATDYVRNSILTPGGHVVPGFENIMPPVFGQVLSDQDIADLIAYMLTLP